MEELKNCNQKFIYVDGYKFTRDESTGYHRCNAIRKRLHQYVWERSNGKIEKGYHIHHIDGDKKNNALDNLELMHGSKHISLHQSQLTEEQLLIKKVNFEEKARPKAIEWHKSEEGREWHKEHYLNTKDKLYKKGMFKCEQCNNDFEATDNGVNRFCSNKCKSKWRRDSGIDDVVRRCEYCGDDFEVNKYKKRTTCSRSCTNKNGKNKAS